MRRSRRPHLAGCGSASRACPFRLGTEPWPIGPTHSPRILPSQGYTETKRCRGETYLGVLAPVSLMFDRYGTEYSVHLLDTPAAARGFEDEVMAQPALIEAFRVGRVKSTVFRRTTLIAYNTTGVDPEPSAVGRRPRWA